MRTHRPPMKIWDHHQCSEHAQCVYLSYYYYFRILIFLSHHLLLRFRSHWWELAPTTPVGASYGASYLRQLSPVSPPVTDHNWWRNWWQLAEKLVTTGGDSWRRNWRQLAELAPVPTNESEISTTNGRTKTSIFENINNIAIFFYYGSEIGTNFPPD